MGRGLGVVVGTYLIQADHELVHLHRLMNEPVVGLDIETAGPNPLVPHQGRIRLVQLASAEDVLVVDMDKVAAIDILHDILTDPKTLKVIHNAKFEVKFFLHCHHLVIKPLFCTYLASKLLAKGQAARHSLEETVRRYLGESMDKRLQNSDWSGNLSEEQIQYAARDASILLPLHQRMAEQLGQEKLRKVSQLEFRTVVPVAAMECRGLAIDRQRIDRVAKDLRRRIGDLETKILEELHGPDALPGMNLLNLNAPEQVKEALQLRGIQVPDTTDARLRPLASQYPFIADLLQFRHLTKMLSGGLKPLLEHTLPETGRVHANYHQIASASGRFACSEPNVQQVPREREVRACIQPGPGYTFIVADYSQVELRVAAGLSGDALMLDAYSKGGDLHRLTAALTMGKPVEEVTNQERQAAKAINFGLIYAMGPRGLQQSAHASYGVDMSLEEATLFRNRYFSNYQGIAAWQRHMEKKGHQQRYVRTAAGRIRAYGDEDIRITELFNTPVQGTAAEGLKSAMCIFWDRVQETGLDAAIVAVIHDEVIVEVKKEQTESARKVLVEAMVQGIQWLVPEVPFAVDAEIGESWAVK